MLLSLFKEDSSYAWNIKIIFYNIYLYELKIYLRFTRDIHSASILVRNKYAAKPLWNKIMKKTPFFGATKMNSTQKIKIKNKNKNKNKE